MTPHPNMPRPAISTLIMPCGHCGQDAAVGPAGIACVHCRPASTEEKRAAAREAIARKRAERARLDEAAAYVREVVSTR